MPAEPTRKADGKFAPGTCGGPGYAGRRLLLTPHLIRYLEEMSDDNPKLTRAQNIALTLARLAEKGEKWAIEIVFERSEGKVREQPVDDQSPREPIRLLNFGEDEPNG